LQRLRADTRARSPLLLLLLLLLLLTRLLLRLLGAARQGLCYPELPPLGAARGAGAPLGRRHATRPRGRAAARRGRRRGGGGGLRGGGAHGINLNVV
jgi:hypothetical protein